MQHAGTEWVLEAFWACGLAGALREKLLRMCTALEALENEHRSEGEEGGQCACVCVV